MPQVAITLAEGRTPSQVRDLMHEVHAAVLRTTGTKSEYIRVVVHEVPRVHWATGDVTLAEMDSDSDASHLAGQQPQSAADGRLHDITRQEQQ